MRCFNQVVVEVPSYGCDSVSGSRGGFTMVIPACVGDCHEPVCGGVDVHYRRRLGGRGAIPMQTGPAYECCKGDFSGASVA